jgi:hypothetical protein
VIEIRKLRHEWSRAELIALKSSLAKLINPFGANVDSFNIFIHAPDELAADQEARAAAKKAGEELLSEGVDEHILLFLVCGIRAPLHLDPRKYALACLNTPGRNRIEGKRPRGAAEQQRGNCSTSDASGAHKINRSYPSRIAVVRATNMIIFGLKSWTPQLRAGGRCPPP